MPLLSLITLSGALLASSGQPSLVAPKPVQEKPQTFVFVRPTAQAMGLVVKETHDLTLTALSTKFGEKPPVSSTAEMRLRTRLEAALAEERLDLGSGPEALRRRYIALEGELQIMDPASVNEAEGTWEGLTLKLQTPLEGKSVVFQPFDGQPDGYGRHFDGEALRESSLPKLSAPAHWGALLPPSKDESGSWQITLGDAWGLDPAVLEPLLAPGGFLGWRTEKPDRKSGEKAPDSNNQVLRAFAGGVGGNLQLAFDGEMVGEANATLVTVGVDPDHGRFGEIYITYTIDFSADRDEFVRSRRFADEGELGLDVVGGALKVRLDGNATVKWGLDLGRPFAALVAADETVSMTVKVRPESGELVSQTISMSGAVVNGLTFRERPLSPIKRVTVDRDK